MSFNSDASLFHHHIALDLDDSDTILSNYETNYENSVPTIKLQDNFHKTGTRRIRTCQVGFFYFLTKTRLFSLRVICLIL